MMDDIRNSDLERAIQEGHGADHFLTSASEDDASFTKHFPDGTRSWIVEHESTSCDHDPRCHWFGRVYYYQGHFTLIKDMEMPFISLGETIERVTRASQN